MPKSLFRSSPESVGIPSLVILKTLEELQKQDSLNSLIILRHGHVCAEGWWKPYSPDIPHMLFSLSKSFVSVAIGMLQAEGKLNIHDTLISYFPEYESVISDPDIRKITLKNLLTMGTGHNSCAAEFMQKDPDGDYVSAFFASKLTYAPGERFVYNSGGTYMLSALLHKLTGSNVREYLLPRLFKPLGITPGIWENCPRGINLGGWGFNLKTEDIAKFGQLILDGGKFEGKQLIPAAYLQEATSKQIDNSMNNTPDWKCGYGYQFWLSRHGFRGDGACGQYAVILPEYDMVIAVTSGLSNMQRVLDVFWDHLLPGIKSGPLPENPELQKTLKEMLNSLFIPIAQGNLDRRGEAIVWRFQMNESGIKSVAVSFGEKECAFIFDTSRGTERICAGFGFNCDNTIQFSDLLPRRSAASAAWNAEGKLEVYVCNYETPFRDVYTFDFESKTFTRTSNSNFLHPALSPLEVEQ